MSLINCKCKSIHKKISVPRIRAQKQSKSQEQTYSVTDLIRKEVKKILMESDIPIDYLNHKEVVDKLIDKCLQERVMIMKEDGTELSLSQCNLDANNQMVVKAVAVEMVDNVDKDRLIVENFQIFERRMCSLEKCFSMIADRVTKIESEQIVLNMDRKKIREDIRKFLKRTHPKRMLRIGNNHGIRLVKPESACQTSQTIDKENDVDAGTEETDAADGYEKVRRRGQGDENSVTADYHEYSKSYANILELPEEKEPPVENEMLMTFEGNYSWQKAAKVTNVRTGPQPPTFLFVEE